MRSGASRILVIKHGAFGDIIQADGAMADIRAHHRDAEITVLTTRPYRRLLERSPSVDRVMIDSRHPRWRLDHVLALRRQLRAAGFAGVYDLQNSTRTASYRRWMLPDVPWSGNARRRTMLLRAEPQTVPSLQRMATQLRDAGVPVRHATAPDLSWMADDIGPLLVEAGVGHPFVVLVPGSSAGHPEKRWPFYPQLAARLQARGFAVVTAPGPGEHGLAGSIGGTVLTGSRGFLDWFQLAGLFREAAFVVGNDTGPSHLAAHVGTPGLALFGPHVAPAMTGIVREKFGVIAVPDLLRLGCDQVADAVLSRLDGPSNPRRSAQLRQPGANDPR